MDCLVTALSVWASCVAGTRISPGGKRCLSKVGYLVRLIPSCGKGLEVWL